MATRKKSTTTPKPAPSAPPPAPAAPDPAPDATPTAAIDSSGESVLAEAATQAAPDAQPTVELQPPEVAASTVQPPMTDPWRPIYDLEEARALPECHPDLAVPGEAPANVRQIQAFKDTDGRTMVLGKDPAGRMVKVEARQP